MTVSRSKAERRYAETQKKKRAPAISEEIEAATRLRLEKTAKLRQLRIAKETEEAAEKQAAEDIKAAGQSTLKKSRSHPGAL